MFRPGDLSSVMRCSKGQGRSCAVVKPLRSSGGLESPPRCKQRKMEEFFGKNSRRSSLLTLDTSSEKDFSSSLYASSDAGSVVTMGDSLSSCGSEGLTSTDGEVEQQVHCGTVDSSRAVGASKCVCGCHVVYGFEPDLSLIGIADLCMDCVCYEQW